MPLNANRVIIAGSLTRDPEVKLLSGDKAVAGFCLAINRKYRGQDGEMKEDVTFVDIECWGRTAELAGQYLTKGRNCYIEGRLKLESWEDKQTGGKRSKLKILADQIQFIGDAKGREADQRHGSDDGNKAQPTAPQSGSLSEDEPPF